MQTTPVSDMEQALYGTCELQLLMPPAELTKAVWVQQRFAPETLQLQRHVGFRARQTDCCDTFVSGWPAAYMLLQCKARVVAECWMGWCSAVFNNRFTGTLPSELGNLAAAGWLSLL